MVEIDVEPVESIEEVSLPAGVDAPEYVLYGGKGGVGKTTCATATALASATDGTATLLVSTDPAHSLSDILDDVIPATPTRIREDIPLFAVEIDPAEAQQIGDPFGDGMPMGGLEDMFGGEASPLNAGTLPGADEAAAIQLLLEYLDDPRFDRVVVDTAPTGHTLRLLQLPDIMDSFVGQMLRFRERLSGMADSIGSLGGLFGSNDEMDGQMEAGMADLQEFSDRIDTLRRRLTDPTQTDFRVVTIPERMSIEESARLITQLEGFDIPVSTVVVNRVSTALPETVSDEADWFVSPDTEHCEFCRQRWAVQREALQLAQELFQGRTVKQVPLFATDVNGEPMLRIVARCLE